MQRGVREEDMKFTELEQTLMSGLVSLETLVLGNDIVSLKWYNIVVTNYTSASLVPTPSEVISTGVERTSFSR